MIWILYIFAIMLLVFLWGIPIPHYLVTGIDLEQGKLIWDMIRVFVTIGIVSLCIHLTTLAIRWIYSP